MIRTMIAVLCLGLWLPGSALADPPTTATREQLIEAQRVVKACAPVLAKCRSYIDRDVLALQWKLGELEQWQLLLAETDCPVSDQEQMSRRITELMLQHDRLLAATAAEAATARANWADIRPMLAELLEPPSQSE